MAELFGKDLEQRIIAEISLKAQVLIGMLYVMEVNKKDSPNKKDIFSSMDNLLKQIKENQTAFAKFAQRDGLSVTVPFFERYVQAVRYGTPIDDDDRKSMHAIYSKYGL